MAHRGLLGDPPRLGGVAHGRDDEAAVAVRHRRAAQHRIRRIGRLGVEALGPGRLLHLRLAREGRFIHGERHGLDQLAVRRHHLADLDEDRIAHDHLAAGNLAHGAVAQHLHGLLVVHAVQPPEAAHGVPLEDEAHARGQHQCAEDAHGFEKIALDDCDAERQQCSHEQHADQRIAELVGEETPRRILRGRSNDIDSVQAAAFGRLLRSETLKII